MVTNLKRVQNNTAECKNRYGNNPKGLDNLQSMENKHGNKAEKNPNKIAGEQT